MPYLFWDFFYPFEPVNCGSTPLSYISKTSNTTLYQHDFISFALFRDNNILLLPFLTEDNVSNPICFFSLSFPHICVNVVISQLCFDGPLSTINFAQIPNHIPQSCIHTFLLHKSCIQRKPSRIESIIHPMTIRNVNSLLIPSKEKL